MKYSKDLLRVAMLVFVQEEKVHNPVLMEACNEALWLLRSGKKGEECVVSHILIFVLF